MRYGKVGMALIALFFAASANAQPAPWYRWRSKVNGQLVCAQTSPGDGWERASGPYKDSRCDTLIKQ